MIRLARVLIGGAVLALLVGWGVTMWAPRGTGPVPALEASADTLGDYGPVPEFSLIERSGRRVTLTDLRGTVWSRISSTPSARRPARSRVSN